MRVVLLSFLLVVSLTGSANGIYCDRKIRNQKYRSLNGVCNNLYYPYLGSVLRTHKTFLPLEYADGKICPKVTTDKKAALPLARELSSNILFVYDKPNEPNDLSEMHVYFGMFLTHDITLSLVDPNASSLYNCSLANKNCPVSRNWVGPKEKYIKDAQCLLMGVQKGTFCAKDGTGGQTCGCSLCKKEEYQQLNHFTSFIDLSNIYSTDEETLTFLREPGSAKMRLTEDNLMQMAPSTDPKYSNRPCAQPFQRNTTGPCLLSGDREGNLTPFLQAMSTLFLREHNRLVDKLKRIFTDPDILFEEVRRIMIAKLQHITYNEYLPMTLGSCMDQSLKVPTASYVYKPKVDATTYKEFVGAAFRFGHSQAGNLASLGFIDNQVPLGHLFTLKPYLTSGSNVMEKMMLGTMRTSAKKTDPFYVNQTINNFRFDTTSTRSDLGATDIERGRQYGLQSYVKYRKFLKLEVPESFDDLKKYMLTNYVEKLKTYFGKDGLKDLDLVLGGAAEYRVDNCSGILFGPTFQQIIERQFYNFKYGDRFWYEIMEKKWSFTPEQLKEIQKTTLSGMICLNTELRCALEKVMKRTSRLRSCKRLAAETDLNIAHWALNIK